MSKDNDDDKDQALRVPSEQEFSGKQLSLFQGVLSNADDKDAHSNTIDLWDAIPKYHMTLRRQSTMRQSGGFLPTVTHEFQYKGTDFKVRLSPARIDTDDGEKEYYPSETEELIEDVLRKFACIQGCGFHDGDRTGVTFSIHAIKKELAARGHTRSYDEIRRSLEILHRCNIELRDAVSKGRSSGPILPAIIAVSRAELDSDPNARWYAQFAPLVTLAIEKLSFRQFNYRVMLGHRSQLARWFHKRLAHNFTQASQTTTYTIKLTTVARDSGLIPDKRAAQRLSRTRAALAELVEHNILRSFDVEVERGPRNAIVDATFTLLPHIEFCKAAKAANARAKQNLYAID